VKKSSMSIAPGVIVEMVGDDVVVMVPGSTEVIRLSGDSAHTIRAIHAGDVSVLPSHTVTELMERGILISRAGMSRRGVLKAGAIGAGAGIAVLTMPSVAAASSPGTTTGVQAFWTDKETDGSSVTRIDYVVSGLPANVTGGGWNLTWTNVTSGGPPSIGITVTDGGFFGDAPISGIQLAGGVPTPSTITATLTKDGVTLNLEFAYQPGA